MKASELQLGDWIQGYLPDTYSKVCGILNETRIAVTTKDGTYMDVSIEDIQPILLTSEILEKNGFGYIEKDENILHYYLGEPYFSKDLNLHIGTYNTGRFWLNYYYNYIHGLRYVHQLQEAFRLFGIEKEIEL